jgi:hypothetical protein
LPITMAIGGVCGTVVRLPCQSTIAIPTAPQRQCQGRETRRAGSPTGSAIFGPLPYPMRLGRKPIAIATTASTVATRMAAASISTSFSAAQSPRWLGALCQVCALLQRHLHQSRVAGGLAAPC